jgi:hypothetical protein
VKRGSKSGKRGNFIKLFASIAARKLGLNGGLDSVIKIAI